MLNNEYLTIWITADLLLEPNVVIRLGVLSRHFPLQHLLNLYQRAVLSNTSSLDFTEALTLLGLSNEDSARALIFSSIWSQSRTTRQARAANDSSSDLQSLTFLTTSL